MNRPRVLSLCSGYGGLDLAIERVLDAVTVAHAEVEPAACKVLEARWPGVPNIGDLKIAAALNAHWWRGFFEVVSAGYPCQPFSTAGRRKGTDDPRHLWPYVAQTIRGVRPRLVVLENVAGHRTLGLDAVLADLAALGYDAAWTSLRAADVGAPHGRERLFIVAQDADRAAGGEWRLAASGQAEGRRPRPDAGGRDRAPTANAERGQLQRRREPRAVGGPPTAPGGARDQRQRDGHTSDRCGEAAADTDDRSGDGREREPLRREIERAAAPRSGAINWGEYATAIERWERTLDRVAPAPTETGPRGGQRLAPRFVEWMMGLPAGWVTDVPGVSRNAQLKMLGNGVVPQQAATALRHLLSVWEEVAAA